METRYIAAIEIGSSKIKGIVATVDPTTTIKVLAIEESDTGDSVRYGRVLNAREVGDRINDIIRRLENNPAIAPGRIKNIYMSIGGRSVASKASEATVNLGNDVEITDQTVNRLEKDARYNMATDLDVLAVSPRHYSVDGAAVKKVIGTFGRSLHGEFTFVVSSPENRRNLDRVKIESAGTEINRAYIPRAIAVADTAISDTERKVGCALVDLGAETTTVSVYRDGTLQYLVTLPMGSANITKDLAASLGMTEEAAENLKITKGEAIADRTRLVTYETELREILNIVTARAGEIAANINHRLTTAGYTPENLPEGIILTGGGSRLRGFSDMLQTQTKMKVRNAVVDSGITVAGAPSTPHLDVIAIVKYALGIDPATDCLSFPPKENRQQTGSRSNGQSDIPRRRLINENDPDLLNDDKEDWLDQPDNINDYNDNDTDEGYIDDDPDGELPEPGETAEDTRQSLIERFRRWIRPSDTTLDD